MSFEEKILKMKPSSKINNDQKKGRIEGYKLAKWELLQKIKELESVFEIKWQDRPLIDNRKDVKNVPVIEYLFVRRKLKEFKQSIEGGEDS